MPSPWTFSIPAIAAFLGRHLRGRTVIVDPFCGQSVIGTHRNDLRFSGEDAEPFVRRLIADGVRADAILFDPPYSPRQVAEVYQEIGRKVTMHDTQNGTLNKTVRAALKDIAKSDAVALSFGWNSSRFGTGWDTREILLVQHGGPHNDTICVAQVRRPDLFTPEREAQLAGGTNAPR